MKKIFCMFLFLSSIIFANWTQREFQDEFGDSIGNKYIISSTINGSFSNSATKNSNLFVQVLISSDSNIGIFMSEYSQNSPGQKFVGKIKAKNEEGKIYSSTVDEWNDSEGLSVYDKRDLINFLKTSKEVKFYIADKYSSSYSFILKTDEIKEALELMNTK